MDFRELNFNIVFLVNLDARCLMVHYYHLIFLSMVSKSSAILIGFEM